MAQPRESGFNPSSPRSSTGNADSYKHDGTPDTRLTAFSPDEGSARSSKYYGSLSLSASDPQPLRFPGKPTNGFRSSVTHVEKDPFISSGVSDKRDQRLSPTASAFQPVSISLAGRGHLDSIPLHGNTAAFDINRALHTSTLGFLNSSTVSRYLALSSNLRGVTLSDVEALLSHLEKLGFSWHGKRQTVGNGGKVYIRCSNIHDAVAVSGNTRYASPDWCVDFVRPDFWKLVNPGDVQGDLSTEGQVFLVVVLGPGCATHPGDVESTVYRLLNSEAEIFAFVKQASSTDVTLRFLVEFCEVDAAVLIVNKFNQFTAENITLLVSLNQSASGLSHLEKAAEESRSSLRRGSWPAVSSGLQNMSLVKPSPPTGTLIAAGRPNAGAMGIHPLAAQIGMYPMIYHNQTPSTPHYILDQYQNHGPVPYHIPNTLGTLSPMYQPVSPTALVPLHGDYSNPKPLGFMRPDGRRQNAMRVNRSPYYNAAGHHNHVDINRIRDGIDVRTTIMLRNIPNKVDQAMLKRIIDESSWGKYDFMYLRIDFANDCNVGYAFINFVDPLDIIDFVEARGNQRWNCFKSDKVAEISYATIQGKDCLVQKFRNSSVMLEAAHYRPKLYYTTNGPHPELAGQEEQFPGPDNQSKMKRSCENAEHVGLFTPNAGQHFRDEQRRRRSQYDRGTRLAALEEYDYDTNFKLYPGQ